jgi:AraC-like DNA-binding protein/mannose-6-phosphate isomerase-like protein (cupin superfamily)
MLDKTMQNTLSLRAYTKRTDTHIHSYHQLVLPTQGAIVIEIPNFRGSVSVGECVVIKKGQEHHFKADEAARFVVADMNSLPDHLTQSEQQVFDISAPLQSFLLFVEKQLVHQVHPDIEQTLFQLFEQLLAQQTLGHQIDPRIRRAQTYIIEHLAHSLDITILSQQAHLSATQFKTLFKRDMGQSPMHYITSLRMEKAKALLTHSDLPVQQVAEQVGYNDLSAFSRRFRQHFGLSPSQLSGRH